MKTAKNLEYEPCILEHNKSLEYKPCILEHNKINWKELHTWGNLKKKDNLNKSTTGKNIESETLDLKLETNNFCLNF